MRTQEKTASGNVKAGGWPGRCRAVPSAVAQLRQGKTLMLGASGCPSSACA
jgi:hypothetical protein